MNKADHTIDGYKYIEYEVFKARTDVFTLRWKGSDKGSIWKGRRVVAQLDAKVDGETVVAIGESVIIDEKHIKCVYSEETP
ncbi:hypothetical protein CORC01_04864 [Colletotrichum orchidophilum]|uniref:Uncharacterized protein n=1 Tax=Colletotrichum orchidophilum TaxID=1209926 RepID=A0A1G4BF19_9PEZI|nr:uncharacterized protein CORC01_04864 [Colletotrichum orchidophilum]OHE99963.1 hypothetical protein CORC01_04864 [Colletotrichum orchidophilum]